MLQNFTVDYENPVCYVIISLTHFDERNNVMPRSKRQIEQVDLPTSPGQLMLLRKGDIKIPTEYQRLLDRHRARRIADKFDWFLFGVLKVSYRNGEYFVVDGQHRLYAATLRDDIDTVPAILFDFNGPEHEAQVFVMEQVMRKGLVTQDIHKAELFAGGDFGKIARSAQAFIDTTEASSVPLSTIRQLWRRYPHAFESVGSLINELVAGVPLRKDFLEAMIHLEHSLPEGESLASKRDILHAIGAEELVAEMLTYLSEHAGDRIGKVASPRAKAEALAYVIKSHEELQGHTQKSLELTPA